MPRSSGESQNTEIVNLVALHARQLDGQLVTPPSPNKKGAEAEMNDYHKLVSRMQRITMSVLSLTSGLFWALWSLTSGSPTLHFPSYTMIHLFRNVQKKFSNLRPTFRHRFIILMSKLFLKELESYVNKINHSGVSDSNIFVEPM